ncbi:hypothetical protein JCM11641_005474 [Rhodosporidiobolus odoratus]
MSLANAFASRGPRGTRGRRNNTSRLNAAAALNPHAAAQTMFTSSASSTRAFAQLTGQDDPHPSSQDDDSAFEFLLNSPGGHSSPGGARGGKRKLRTSEGDGFDTLLGDDVGASNSKKVKNGTSQGGGMFGDDDDTLGGSGAFESSLHDAFALTAPSGGNSAAGVGSSSLGGAGANSSFLSNGDFNLPLGDMGGYGSTMDDLQFAQFLQSPAAPQSAPLAPAPPPASAPVKEPSPIPDVAGELEETVISEPDLTVDDPVPEVDFEGHGSVASAPSHASSPPAPNALDLDIDLASIDPSLQEIASSTLEGVQIPSSLSGMDDQSERQASTDSQLAEIQKLLGYHGGYSLPPGGEDVSLSIPDTSTPVATSVLDPVLEQSQSTLDPALNDISTAPSISLSSASPSISISAVSESHSLPVHEFAPPPVPVPRAPSASTSASASASTSTTPTPAPPAPTGKKKSKAKATVGKDGKLIPRPAGGSRHHTPVINHQAPTPRNPNGTAPGASDFAPPGGGPTAREAAAGFAGDEENPHPCPLTDCDKKFVRKSDFLRHYRIHTGERPFVCTIDNCGKSFIQRSALTVHQRVHSGEKPHACQDCGRLFSDSSSLARHRRIHAGLKPFACEMCGTKSFSRKATLTRHQNICPGRPEGYIPQIVEEVPKKKKKSSAAKAKALKGKGKLGGELGSIDVASHPLYNLHGAIASSHSASQTASPEPDLAVGDPHGTLAAQFDLSTLAALPPNPSVDGASSLHTYRHSPSATFLNLSADPYTNGPSPRLAQSRRLPSQPQMGMGDPSLSATRSTAQPKKSTKGKGGKKGKGKKGKGKGKGKGKAAEEDYDLDLEVDYGPSSQAFSNSMLGLQLDPSLSIPTSLPANLSMAFLPPLPSLPPLQPLPSTLPARGPPAPIFHEDSDECGSECDGECGREKSDIEREEAEYAAKMRQIEAERLAAAERAEAETQAQAMSMAEDGEGEGEEGEGDGEGDEEDEEETDDEEELEIEMEERDFNEAVAAAALVHGFGHVPDVSVE